MLLLPLIPPSFPLPLVYHAPPHTRRHGDLGTFAALDAGIMLQTLMLSAQSHGLATCAQGALATWGSPVRDEFDIPAGYKLLCGLSMGYASDHNVNAFNPGTHKSGKANRVSVHG